MKTEVAPDASRNCIFESQIDGTVLSLHRTAGLIIAKADAASHSYVHRGMQCEQASGDDGSLMRISLPVSP